MNIYKTIELEEEMEQIAFENNGVVPDDLMEELVVRQTGTMESIERMLKYVRHLELFQESAETEVKRITDAKKKAGNIVDNIKKYIKPYVLAHGKIDVGTFKLGTRKSESLEIVDEKLVPACFKTIVQETKVSKMDIRKAIHEGVDVPGVKLVENQFVTIK